LASIFFLALFSACNVTQSVPKGEHLLEKNKIKFDEKVKSNNNLKEEVQNLVIQKPNTKMFGLISFRLGIYNLAYDKKENKFRWWLKNKVGESPVIYNPKVSSKSAENIRLYMFNQGFLNTTVKYKATFKPKKVTVNYSVVPGEQFTTGKITLPASTNTLLEHVSQIQDQTLIQSDDAFSINTLNDERARITTHLRNMGYYNFRKDYVVFELDSNDLAKTVDISMSLKGPTPDSWHRKYTINKIYILTDNLQAENENAVLDTLLYDGFYFIGAETKYKPKVIAHGIFLEQDKYFRLDSYQNTLRKLASYGTFKFVDIQFTPLDKDNKKYLDVFIYLTSSKKQTISVDVEARHNFIGLTGASVGVTYQNKNLSKSADLLELKVSTGIEFNVGNGLTTPVNNSDVIIEMNYYLNRFLLPFPLKKTSKYNNVKTRFSLQYNYERRIQFYSLHSNSFNFGYEWNESANKKHIYNPISATVLFLPEKNVSDDFRDRINEIPSLKRSFEEQLILGSNYAFFYNNKKSESDRSFVFFKGNIALAGNLIHGIVAITKQGRNNPKPYSLFNREYSQFARFEANIIHNLIIGKHASFNSRFNTGVIVPFGNSGVAPYFQQFYVGGSNSIRAFRLRALGPGTYADEANIDNPNFFFDQAGDFKLEGNAELRFDVYKFFKAALFVDAGNVWLLKADPDREGGTISKGNFFNAIAVGVGFGLRLDFDYFVIRTDFALPLVDPRFDDSRKYPLNDFKFGIGKNSWFRKNTIFHLAIGYPF
jgi:outer membrane protein insertion porin family